MMWDKFEKRSEACARYCDALEQLQPGIDASSAQDELREMLPAEVLAHAQECETCVESSELFWAARVLMAEDGLGEAPEVSPWFAKRVMSAIAEREVETREVMVQWRRKVSQVASKLALVSAGALLVASTWVYDLRWHSNHGNAQQAKAVGSAGAAGSVSAEASSNYLFDVGPLTPNPEEAMITSDLGTSKETE